MRGHLRVLIALLGLMLFSSEAQPHEVRPAYLQIDEITPNHFDVLWKQPSIGSVTLHLEPTVFNGLLTGTPDANYVANSFVIRRWTRRAVSRDTFEGTTIRIDGLQHTQTDALVIIRFNGGQQIQAVLTPGDPEFQVHLTGAGAIPIERYLSLGIDHILKGFDHLTFLLCLVLLVSGRLKLLKTVTAFTIAHSTTLAAAALGYIHLKPSLIESLVALSIIFVAVELTIFWRGRNSIAARFPWLIALTFGLLHGFAFAGSLAVVGLPAHNILGALLLFNCGVELGQLLFVGGLLLLIMILRSHFAVIPNAVRWVIPYMVGTLASYWMFERIDALPHV